MSSSHVLPLRVYFQVFGALLALTGVTTWIAYQDLGVLNTPVAIGIASVKTLLVILFFMHVRYSSRLVMVVAASGFVWLLIFFALTLQDYVTRTAVPAWG